MSEIKCYENLANAIIIQAVKDYRKGLRTDNRKLKRECERFFRSDWYMALTAVPGETLIKKLRTEVK